MACFIFKFATNRYLKERRKK